MNSMLIQGWFVKAVNKKHCDRAWSPQYGASCHKKSPYVQFKGNGATLSPASHAVEIRGGPC